MKPFDEVPKAVASALLCCGAVLALHPGAEAATLSFAADAGGRQDVTVSVPLQVDDATGIRSADIRVEFTPAVVQAVAVSLTPLSSTFQLAVNMATPGVLIVSMFGAAPLSGSGDLLRIDFRVDGALGQVTPLDLVMGELNEGAIASSLQDGTFTVLPTYLLSSRSVNAGGGDAVSASYRARWSLGQESVVEASASFRHVLQSGFWSFAGTGMVPVMLSVSPAGMSWTGNSPPYTIYRSGDCSDVTSSPLAVTPETTFSDPTLPAAGQVLCYLVQPTPPGS